MTERSLEQVVDEMGGIVEACTAQGSRLGVFPAMYHRVTVTVADGLAAGHFTDPERVRRLVSIFAGFYLDAYAAKQAGQSPSRCWDLSFDFARRGRGSIVQHLLLGMNAHINLDLGVATAAVSTREDLHILRSDFDLVNGVLFALLDAFQEGLGSVSPWMARLDRIGLGFDEELMRVGIRLGRAEAWDFAELLVGLEGPERAAAIADRDEAVWRLGRLICAPYSVLHLANRVVAWHERHAVPDVLAALGRAEVDLAAVAKSTS
jgi:hypothetical protein